MCLLIGPCKLGLVNVVKLIIGPCEAFHYFEITGMMSGWFEGVLSRFFKFVTFILFNKEHELSERWRCGINVLLGFWYHNVFV